MNVNAHMPNINSSQNAKIKVAEAHSKNINTNFTQKISKDDAAELRALITQNANDIMMKSTSIQASLKSPDDDFASKYESFQSFLSEIGYEGKALTELSQEEAAELISEDGIFGIKQTSERIADFVISGAGGDEDRLRAGREGMLQGFKDAEAMWGGELPEISKKTMQAAIQMVDKAMHDLGYSILDQEV